MDMGGVITLPVNKHYECRGKIMVETLRKKARKSNMLRVIFSVIGVVVLLAVTKFAIFDVITGPTRLDITQDPDSYKGKYVTIDADFFLYDYIEHTTTTTRKYGGSSTSTNGYSYLVFQSVDDYEKESSIWYFYSIYLNKGRQQEMASKIDEAFAFFNDETGQTPPPEPVTVKGVWNPMDAQTEKYFRDALVSLNVTETEYDKLYFYELDTKNIGGLNAPLFWALMAAAVGLAVFALASGVGFFGNGYMKNIQKYLQKDSSVSIGAIEEDFNLAHLVDKQVWIGKKWTLYMEGNVARILPNKELIWGYYYQRTGRHSVSEMRLYTKDKKLIHIGMSENATQEALRVYEKEQPQMVIGYSSELEKMFNKNFADFMNLKYNPAMTAGSGGFSQM